jgi:hypothetical protein
MLDPRAPQDEDVEQGKGSPKKSTKMTKKDWMVTISLAAVILLFALAKTHLLPFLH